MAESVKPVFILMCLSVLVSLTHGQCEIKWKKVEFNESLVSGYTSETPVSTAEDCASLCLSTSGCKSVGLGSVYVTSMTCYLYDTIAYSGSTSTHKPGMVYYWLLRGQDEVPDTYTCDAAQQYCYKLYTQTKSWHGAKLVCEQDGGTLFLADSADKYNLLRTTVEANYNTGPTYVLIGATDEIIENQWNWLNGVPVDRDNFVPGRPDNHQNSQHCLVYCTGCPDGNGLDDRPCDTAAVFICEIVLR